MLEHFFFMLCREVYTAYTLIVFISIIAWLVWPRYRQYLIHLLLVNVLSLSVTAIMEGLWLAYTLARAWYSQYDYGSFIWHSHSSMLSQLLYGASFAGTMVAPHLLWPRRMRSDRMIWSISICGLLGTVAGYLVTPFTTREDLAIKRLPAAPDDTWLRVCLVVAWVLIIALTSSITSRKSHIPHRQAARNAMPTAGCDNSAESR